MHSPVGYFLKTRIFGLTIQFIVDSMYQLEMQSYPVPSHPTPPHPTPPTPPHPTPPHPTSSSGDIIIMYAFMQSTSRQQMHIHSNIPRVNNIKEILTGHEVNMQLCCPDEWEYSTRRNRVEYSHYEGQQNCIFTENGPVNISIIIFGISK